MGIVKGESLESVRPSFVSFYGIIQYLGGAKNGLRLEIVYHNLL